MQSSERILNRAFYAFLSPHSLIYIDLAIKSNQIQKGQFTQFWRFGRFPPVMTTSQHCSTHKIARKVEKASIFELVLLNVSCANCTFKRIFVQFRPQMRPWCITNLDCAHFIFNQKIPKRPKEFRQHFFAFGFLDSFRFRYERVFSLRSQGAFFQYFAPRKTTNRAYLICTFVR